MRCPILKNLPAPPLGKTGWPWTTESKKPPATMPDGTLWPKVSIITPSYNQGQFIEETIRSVLLQGYPNLEYIIIDGGSTDNSLKIIKKYETWLTFWISEPDRGQSHAINKGWKMATGQILAYFNSDDIYLPDAIMNAAIFLSEDPNVSMIYGDCNIINEKGEIVCPFRGEEYDIRKMLYANIVPQQTVFFRKHVLDDVGYLDESLHMVMDRDMWIRIGLKLQVKYIPFLLAHFRKYTSCKSHAQTDKFLPERLKVIDKVVTNPDTPKEIKALKRKFYSHNYIISGTHYYRNGEHRKAARLLMKSVLIYPPRLFETDVRRTLIKSLMGKNLVYLCKKLKNKLYSIGNSCTSMQ